MAFLRLCLTAALLTTAAAAQARFDLAGPTIDIRVTRGATTLPIAAVPNLQPGDTLWLHPALPPTQSVHYLLIAVFLRGTTNPPPANWFTRIETWDKKVREEGTTLTVPPDAQQAILFLAPETGGDFATLRSAVQGRPGVFVRASQDLTEAGFEQARIDAYLEAIKRVPPTDPAALQKHSDLLARTLALRPNPDCFKRPPDQQYTCLTQTGTASLLDDGHAQTLLSALSNGSGSDFINQASYTRLAGAGNYSAYVGAIVDFARILSTIHTAQYQYIPALAIPKEEALNLRLNTPPSFHNPKSVIVIGLPAIQTAVPPPLRPAEPDHISCLLDPRTVLPITGAPLVFTTAFAHDLTLHIATPTPHDVPLTPDAYSGGLAIAPALPTRKELPLQPVNLGQNTSATSRQTETILPKPLTSALTGTIEGSWGFDHFTGPTVLLQQTPGQNWHLVDAAATLIAGQPNHLEILSTGTACVQSIAAEPEKQTLTYTLATPKTPSGTQPGTVLPGTIEPGTIEPIDLTLNLQHTTTPGAIQLAIQQFGQKLPDHLETRTFAQPARIDTLTLHAGDPTATLTGTSLDQVATITIQSTTYTPTPADPDSFITTTPPPFKLADKLTAEIHLKDGRTLPITTTVLPERPVVTLLSRRAVLPTPSPIQLTSPADLPLGATLRFFLKSRTPFPRTGEIEIANADSSLHTTLTLPAGTLILQDPHTLLATFDPLKLFGPSTFGPFRFRAILPNERESQPEKPEKNEKDKADKSAKLPPSPTPEPTNTGEWLPLATIVRLPTLTSLTCPPPPTPAALAALAAATPPTPCILTGDNLYLLDSIAPTLAFTQPTQVPEGDIDPTLPLARPPTATFYLKLRDDPTTTHTATLPQTKP